MSVHPNLLLWLRMQGNAADSSGRRNHGTPTGGAFVNGALVLNGSSELLTIAAVSGLPVWNAVGPMSVGAWLKPTLASQGCYYGERVAGGATVIRLEIGTGGHALCFVRTNSTNRTSPVATVFCVANEWVHVGYSDKAGASCQFFRNGVPVAMTTSAYTIGTPNANVVEVGVSLTTDYFPGSIRELTVWNCYLTAADWKQVMLSGPMGSLNRR